MKESEISVDPSWKSLYKLSSISSFCVVIIFIFELISYIVFGVGPNTALDWFNMMNKSRIIGVLKLFPLDIFAMTLLIPLFLGLYCILKSISKTLSLIAIILFLIGIVLFYSSNTFLSMLSLSNQYDVSTDELHKFIILSSGQTLISLSNGTGATISALFLSISGLLMSIIMLRKPIFSKLVAYLGIIGNIGTLAYWIPRVGVILMAIAGFPTLIWYFLIAIKLYKISTLIK